MRGFGMWRRRPGLMLLGLVPALLVLLALLAAFVGLLVVVGDVVGWATPFVDDASATVRRLVRVTLALALVAGFVVLAAATFVALTLLVGDPFYARIWRETETLLGGPVPEDEVGLLRSIGDGVALVLLGLATTLGVVAVGLVPVVGTLAALAGGFCISAWFLAGELLGRPLEARGLDRSERSRLLRGHRFQVLTFGLSVQACFLVPLGAVLVMPAAVVGATTLARDLVEA
ncbi:EI24 domain-containing protein [Nocardioides sp. zg-DK7169]|uniref:EI24 domain-containing protein n=1 Tax=Nocardioides sp. zg-DK7169 TaxID=2736600 RepID=UPI0015528A9C|nr:EI24 domain-containing protein [Nocardioides sp. zg-DK7169]